MMKTSDKQPLLNVRLDNSLMVELNSYAEAEGVSRSDAVRDLLSFALASKKGDLFANPLAEMVIGIMRSELMAFRRVQEEAVEADRELITSTFTEVLAGADANLLFLTSLLSHPESDADPEDLFSLYRMAGRYSAVGYPYDEALSEAEKALGSFEREDDDREAMD